MKPHPRIRKTIKWVGAAVTALLVVAWIASEIRYAEWSFANRSVCLWPGHVSITRILAFGTPSWYYSQQVTDWRPLPKTWWFSYFHDPFRASVTIPLGSSALVWAVASAFAWRLDTLDRRRARRGLNLCPKCSYDRAGIAGDAKCPECGSVAPLKPHPRPPIIRKTIKWGGAVVTALLAVVWIGSGWWRWESGTPAWRWAIIYRGHLAVGESFRPHPFFNPITPMPSRPGRKAVEITHMTGDDRQATIVLNLRDALYPTPIRSLFQGFRWSSGAAYGWSLYAPLWTPVLIALLATCFAWRWDAVARRRARFNLCSACDYDRAGIAGDARCPECGSQPAAAGEVRGASDNGRGSG